MMFPMINYPNLRCHQSRSKECLAAQVEAKLDLVQDQIRGKLKVKCDRMVIALRGVTVSGRPLHFETASETSTQIALADRIHFD